MVREPLQVSVLLVDPRASPRWRDLGEVRAWREICGPALLFAGDHASLYRQIAPARRCRISTLWENYLQSFDNQLDPAVFFDGQDGDDFASGGNQNRNHSSGGGIHMK